MPARRSLMHADTAPVPALKGTWYVHSSGGLQGQGPGLTWSDQGLSEKMPCWAAGG